MPDLRFRSVVAISVADIHLSHQPPLARADEPSWYDAMARPLNELKDLAQRCRAANPSYEIPILCAGDLFHSWRSPPELINFALQNLPPMYAVPGQHDLPHHNYEDLHKSPFWTLVQAGRITLLEPRQTQGIGAVSATGFPWGFAPKPCLKPHDLALNIAVIHSYVWTKATGYANAPEKQRLRAYAPKLTGYDVAIFGDNHQGFLVPGKNGSPTIHNCGGFMRRRTDEKDYRPSVGLIHQDGTITRHYLDTKKEKFLTPEKIIAATKMVGTIVADFVEDLLQSAGTPLDFKQAVREYTDKNNTPEDIKTRIFEILDA